MAENAWKYGWLMSYPLGDNGELFNQRTCFHYEPWHYRYLGREIARKVHNSGLTIREYLWRHYTMVDPVNRGAVGHAYPHSDAIAQPLADTGPDRHRQFVSMPRAASATATAPWHPARRPPAGLWASIRQSLPPWASRVVVLARDRLRRPAQ